MDTNNRFYRVDNNKDLRQYPYIYINLDDISSVEYPNESLNVGKLTTKTGKEHFIPREEVDKIIKLLNVINLAIPNINYRLVENG